MIRLARKRIFMNYDPLTADLPHRSKSLPATYWFATAGQAPEDDGQLSANVDCDVAVIGGGYTGLSCAYFLAKEYGVRTRVLEAHQPGWGCSGRNGSFMRPAIGRLWWWQCIERYGHDTARQLFHESLSALGTMRELIRDGAIDCDQQPDGWLRVAHKPSRVKLLEREQRVMEDVFDYNVNLLGAEELRKHGHGGTEAYAALHYPEAFAAHPLKVLHGLLAMARQAGAVVHSKSPVTGWERKRGCHELSTPAGIVTAKRVVIATNGYSTEKLHPALKARLIPVLSSIVVTRPLSPQERQAAEIDTTNVVTDTRKLLNFYRVLPDGRLLMGSRGAISESPRGDRRAVNRLLNIIAQKFPGLTDVTADYHWSGWVALSNDSMPRVHSLQDEAGVSYAIGYNGSGTTASVHAGRLLAGHLAAGTPISAVLDSPLPPIPLARFRRLGQRLAFMAFRCQDAR